MDLEQLYKQLQEWTNRVPLVILGSGASVPFGMPSMWKLGEYIKYEVKLTDPEDLSQFKEFEALFDKNGDLENTLSMLHLRPNVLSEIVNRTWDFVSRSDLQAYDNVVLKGIDFPLRRLVEYLVSTADKKLTFVTTNYDRLAEYASSLAKTVICTGYSQNYVGHFSAHIHTNNLTSLKGFNGQVDIWKVHGSLDWFKNNIEESIQLPLRSSIPKELVPLIVTPGLSKYSETHMEPYRTIFAQADKAIEEANGFLCIGYGFNDIHVQPKLLAQIKARKPIIVIAKELTPKTKQSIIGQDCKNYILMEEGDKNSTKVFSSSQGEFNIPDASYWMLGEYLKLIIN